MSTELFMRGLFALLMGGGFCWAVHRNKNVEDTFDPEQNHQRYLPLVSGVILPVFVLGTAAVMLIVRPAGWSSPSSPCSSACFCTSASTI